MLFGSEKFYYLLDVCNVHVHYMQEILTNFLLIKFSSNDLQPCLLVYSFCLLNTHKNKTNVRLFQVMPLH